MRECPRHPGIDTMIPCLKCGRYFCRLCEPKAASTHYCPDCYHEWLRNIEDRVSSGKAVKPVPTPSMGGGKTGRERDGGTGTLVGEEPGVSVVMDEKKDEVAAGLRERWLLPLKGIMGGNDRWGMSNLLKRWSSSRERHERRARERREVRKRIRSGKRRVVVSRAKERFKAAAESSGEGAVRAWEFIAARFPVTLRKKNVSGGEVRLADVWRYLLYLMGGGAVIWLLSVVLFRGRIWFVSLTLAIVLAWGCIKVMRGQTGLLTGTVACLVAVFSLLVGDVFVQLLFRFNVVKDIGLSEEMMELSSRPISFLGQFLPWYVFAILVPAAAAAFLVGLWPLPAVPKWRGFGEGGERIRAE